MDHVVLETNGWRANFSPLGAAILQLVDPTGFNWVAPQPNQGRHLFGTIAGPWANRLDANAWGLSANDGQLHLHGGFMGTDLRLWEVLIGAKNSVTFGLDWPEGDEGYPKIDLRVTYNLFEGKLEWIINAKAARPFPMNPVNHAYWNLGAPTIDEHQLKINAHTMYAPGADGMTAPPELPANFNEYEALSGTWDHTFFLRTESMKLQREAAILRYQHRQMIVFTTCPTIHIYSGQFLPQPRSGVCLECGLPPGRWGLGEPTQSVEFRTFHLFLFL